MGLSVRMDDIKPTNPSGFARIMQRIVYADGLMMQKVDAPAPVHLPPHRHPEAQLSFVLRGTLEIRVEKGVDIFEKLVCSEGCVFFIPSNALHEAKVVSKTGATWLSIYSPPRDSYKREAVELSW